MDSIAAKSVSLKWKWTCLISLVFLGLYIVSSYVMISTYKTITFEHEKNDQINEVTALFETMSYEDILKEIEVAKLPNEASKQSLFNRLNKQHIYTRIMDDSERIIYESQRLSTVPFKKVAEQTMTEVINGKDKWIVLSDIMLDNQTVKGYTQIVLTLSDYYQNMANLDSIYFLATVLTTIATIIVSFLLSHILVSPIKHMTDVMVSLKEDAVSKQRMNLSKRKRDELTELSVGFNDLLDTMDLYINQQKQFVEDVSHELRTPVAIIEGHLNLLSRWGKKDPIILDESLSASLLELERMKTLIKEMLDLSRAEQVAIHFGNDITPVNRVVEQVYQNFKLIYPDFTFNLDLDIQGDDEELWIGIARHHLEQVLIILLDNAVKYSDEQKLIHLSVSNTINNVQISIQDFGEGISNENIQRIFGRFYRVDKARSRQKGGNGLGLSIAKELIEGYGGRISVESVLGNGSTFRIEFPLVSDKSRIMREKRKAQQENILE